MCPLQTYLDAPGVRRLAGWIDASELAEPTVVIDLSQVQELTTGALAELIALRQRLLHQGCDLSLVGLHGRARALYELSRLAAVLPAATV